MKKLCLSNTNKKIAGVCGGLAEYFEIDATVVRVLWILAFFLYGLGPLVYLILWLVIPRDDKI